MREGIQLHLPAAASWVTSREQARKYMEDNAEIIPAGVKGQPALMLARLPHAQREAKIEFWLTQYDESGWLPYTMDDGERMRMLKQVEELAAEGHEIDFGVTTPDGDIIWQKEKGS